MLRADGAKILENGKEIKLRGYCAGNWLMMETFMMGFPGVEQQFRRYLKEFAGEEKSQFFIQKLLDHYLEEADIAYMKQLGVNVIRIPFNYRHFEDDQNPYVYKKEGFSYMDKAISLCKKYGIYVILDLHGAQGYQNEDWHCDNYEGKINLFVDAESRNRVIQMWKYIAAYYREEETIAAYDLLNEPVARGKEQTAVLDQLYAYIVAAIREVDPKHMVVVRGNYWGQNFDDFRPPFDDNILYALHYYTTAALQQQSYPSSESGGPYNKETLKAELSLRDWFVQKYQVPCWVSEFGILDDNPIYHQSKIDALKDQLDILNEKEYHWTLWSYKDVGKMGLLRPKKETPWAKLTEDVIRMKQKYNCDYNTVISERWPLSSLIKQYVGDDLGIYYEEARNRWEKDLARIFNDILAKKFAQKIAEYSKEELEELAESFKFENCEIAGDWETVIYPALRK